MDLRNELTKHPEKKQDLGASERTHLVGGRYDAKELDFSRESCRQASYAQLQVGKADKP